MTGTVHAFKIYSRSDFYLQGPALYAYNDAYFTDDDWEGIQMLGESIKEKAVLKVGKFGLGFKSVFHLTGRCEKILHENKVESPSDEVK